jgi:hypothetical protein
LLRFLRQDFIYEWWIRNNKRDRLDEWKQFRLWLVLLGLWLDFLFSGIIRWSRRVCWHWRVRWPWWPWWPRRVRRAWRVRRDFPSNQAD